MPGTHSPWREPTKSLRLRWGSYRGRLMSGIALMFVGGVLIQLTSAYSLYVLPLGLFAHIVGWCILPGIGWRRVVGAAVSALTMVVMLNGAPSTVFLVLPLACWLFTRQRPLLSYAALVIIPVAALLLAQAFPDYGWGIVVVSIAGTVVVGSAWVARSLVAIGGKSTAIAR